MAKLFEGFDTDKANGWHSYEPVYRELLEGRRHTVKGVLELGILHGGSLRAWKAFFPNAEIVGMDCDASTMIRGESRIVTFQGEVGSRIDLRNVGGHLGAYDLIVDDASHRPRDQFHALKVLWPYLSSGGVYVIEDLDLNRQLDIVSGSVLIVRANGLKDFHIHLGPGKVPADDLVILEKE